MPTKKDVLSDPLLKILGTLLLAATTLFAGWVTSSIGSQGTEITNLKVRDAHFDGDLEVINNKVDLLLNMNGVEYKGPAFHQHNQDKN